LERSVFGLPLECLCHVDRAKALLYLDSSFIATGVGFPPEGAFHKAQHIRAFRVQEDHVAVAKARIASLKGDE
jgi:hypothetical protein